MWFHPSRLTSGGQYATTSAAFRARQAAQGLLATTQHLYMGSRQAETARGAWDHSSVPGLSSEPPVWVLGLSGLLAQFQATLGTGFSAVYYHCKGYIIIIMLPIQAIASTPSAPLQGLHGLWHARVP
jgi:hypothetical protein